VPVAEGASDAKWVCKRSSKPISIRSIFRSAVSWIRPLLGHFLFQKATITRTTILNEQQGN